MGSRLTHSLADKLEIGQEIYWDKNILR
jgi:hypothetical protein